MLAAFELPSYEVPVQLLLNWIEVAMVLKTLKKKINSGLFIKIIKILSLILYI